MVIQYFNSKVKILITLILVMYLLLLIGCRTSPDFALQNYPGVIAEDGNLLLHFNLSKDSLVLNNFISRYSNDDISSIIDRTEKLSVSIDGLGPNPKYSILAEGNYPQIITNLAIGMEENWVKHKDKYVWWENQTSGMYASVPIRSVALISNSDLSSELSSIGSGYRKHIPENVKSQFKQAAITIYSRLPGANFYESLNISAEKMSIQEMSFIILKDGDNYNISGLLKFLDEPDAKIFSAALKLGLLIKLRKTGKLSVMKIVHDSRIEVVNNSIIMDNILLDTEEVLELIDGSSQGLMEN